MQARLQEILSRNRERLDILADALLARETLEAAEIDELLGLEPGNRGEEEAAVPEGAARPRQASGSSAYRRGEGPGEAQ